MLTTSYVEDSLERNVRPILAAHGGAVRLVGIQDGVISVELSGACAGCPSADLSTRGFIEDTLQSELPEIQRVELSSPVPDELLSFAHRVLRHEEMS